MFKQTEAENFEWYAVRVKQKHIGGLRTTVVGGDREAFKDRKGRVRQRRIKGTGDRVFVPQLILERAGFQVFLPVKKDMRRANRFGNQQKLVVSPLIVGWVFVGWPVGQERWRDLMALDVVMGVMGTGGRPLRVPSDRVARLMGLWGGGLLSPECHQFMKAGQQLRAGDWARVREGNLLGVDVNVQEVSGGVVKGLISIMGGAIDIPAEFNASALEYLSREGDPGEANAPCRAIAAPCGRCGGVCRPVMHKGVWHTGNYCVECEDCGARGAVNQATPEDAVATWNDVVLTKRSDMAGING